MRRLEGRKEEWLVCRRGSLSVAAVASHHPQERRAGRKASPSRPRTPRPFGREFTDGTAVKRHMTGRVGRIPLRDVQSGGCAHQTRASACPSLHPLGSRVSTLEGPSSSSSLNHQGRRGRVFHLSPFPRLSRSCFHFFPERDLSITHLSSSSTLLLSDNASSYKEGRKEKNEVRYRSCHAIKSSACSVYTFPFLLFFALQPTLQATKARHPSSNKRSNRFAKLASGEKRKQKFVF